MFNKKTFIVAEIGNNHEGNYKIAKELVIQAAKTGVDAVKFQTFKVSEFLSKKSDRYNFYKKLELTEKNFLDLYYLAKKLGLFFISTPLDIPSVKFLEKFADCLKISSADIDYYPLVEAIKKTKKPVIISTGMSDLKRISHTYRNFSHLKKNKIGLLHCISSYPALRKDINLKCITTLKKKFNATIGYSDHSIGLDACISAVALGAKIIEKHFTLDKNFSKFRDHKLSANPSDLKNLVKKIKIVEEILGDNKKKIFKSEKNVFNQTRRYMCSKKNITKDSILDVNNVCWVRGGDGSKPIKNFQKKRFKLLKDKGKFISITNNEFK